MGSWLSWGCLAPRGLAGLCVCLCEPLFPRLSCEGLSAHLEGWWTGVSGRSSVRSLSSLPSRGGVTGPGILEGSLLFSGSRQVGVGNSQGSELIWKCCHVLSPLVSGQKENLGPRLAGVVREVWITPDLLVNANITPRRPSAPLASLWTVGRHQETPTCPAPPALGSRDPAGEGPWSWRKLGWR